MANNVLNRSEGNSQVVGRIALANFLDRYRPYNPGSTDSGGFACLS